MQLAHDLIIDRSEEFDQTAKTEPSGPAQCPHCVGYKRRIWNLRQDNETLQETIESLFDTFTNLDHSREQIEILKSLRAEIAEPLRILRSDITLLIDTFERALGQHPLDFVAADATAADLEPKL